MMPDIIKIKNGIRPLVLLKIVVRKGLADGKPFGEVPVPATRKEILSLSSKLML